MTKQVNDDIIRVSKGKEIIMDKAYQVDKVFVVFYRWLGFGIDSREVVIARNKKHAVYMFRKQLKCKDWRIIPYRVMQSHLTVQQWEDIVNEV